MSFRRPCRLPSSSANAGRLAGFAAIALLSGISIAGAEPAPAPAASSPAAPAELRKDTRFLTGFEAEADLANLKPNGATAEPVTEGASEGSKALRITLKPGEAWPSVFFNQVPAADFRGYGGLIFDVYNPNVDTVAFGVRIDSSEKADGNGNHSRSGKGSIDGRQRVTFVMPFGVDPASLGMKGLPGFGEYRNLGSTGTGPFDWGHIVKWQIFMGRQHADQVLIVDNVRLIPGRSQDFSNIVDKYGQYSREDWPGKITSDADFAAQLKKEDADLAAHPAVPQRNKFGGWANGPQLEATGYFRLAKYQDKWSFVDPEGRLFLSFGPTCVGMGESTILKGREYMFSATPATDPTLAKYAGKDGKTISFQLPNLERKYGADFKNLWYSRAYTRMISWGFNTVGGFSSWETFNNGKVPYTATVWVTGKHARISTGAEQVRAMHDPYDPVFATDTANAINAQASRIKDDPYFLGYFVGNEEHLGYWRGGPKSHYTLVLTALKSPADKSPAKRAFIELLKKKHGDIAKLNTAWGTTFADWNAMNAPVNPQEPYSDGLKADLSMLLTDFADKYFGTVAAAIRAANPKHLYLGCRFAGFSPEILDGAAKHSDAFSFNIYRLRVNAKDLDFLDKYDKPVVIGEFHFAATDRGVFDTGLVGVADQAGRGRAYQDYLRSVLALRNFVGAHWFQLWDQSITGRGMDGENGNVGFLSITDTPYTELIAAARQIHGEMYEVRYGKHAARSQAPPDKAAEKK
ncbi:hypothetical protein DB346_17930 [Verrucomicrobia bacterium LW23]|nr:hypothetical protein DB346_17930 [Verrucomicrobia bacterium LW23]